MEENKNMNAQENQEPEKAPVPEKKGSFVKKIFHKKEEPVQNEEAPEKKPKKGFRQWCAEHKKGIALGAAGTITVLAWGAKMLLQNKPESIDPDMETEPGDWEPEDMESVESTEETSEEEVNAE